MKFQISRLILIIGSVLIVSFAQKNVLIEPSVLKKIEDIINNPVMVYKLDLNEKEKNFRHIDDWFSKYINLDKAKSKQKSGSSHNRFISETNENVPILLKRKMGNPIKLVKPFNIYYIKEPFKRSFIKEINLPTKKTLTNDTLIKIGANFIKENKFCFISELDKLGKSQVVSRKRHLFNKELKEEDKYTLYQHVEFRREFSGLEVINSKQIIDIHPDSCELIAYKNILWTPVDELSGNRLPYFSKDEIVSQIIAAFKKSKVEYKVTEVRSGMYQTDQQLIPILAVYTEIKEVQDESFPEERVLIINLIKSIELKKKPKLLKRPSNAK